MHLAQGLPPLVVPHAVQVEAARPAEQQPPAVLGIGSTLGEEPLELDQARVDEQRPGSGKRDFGALKAERVFQHGPDVEEDVAPAAHAGERVAAVLRVERRATFAEAGEPFDEDERGRRDGRVVLESKLNLNVVAFEALLGADLPMQAHRASR